ncbi:hypothetical protein GCM10016455_25250 [Aliiroseovarius zhejiangensis]|uniref:Lectin-like protein BA14k n=1 Tax=Aliiroseovarius zhejiangensis TaxID=1632025 RepID=A0ABQ3J8Y0_9RHOB|nr:hypothetical protein [Aliiroseovarius zhejiangensis]GHF02902.1 hypothetical protein GCM10016455_25250 [Aliiroseovarius zhejiangensis]
MTRRLTILPLKFALSATLALALSVAPVSANDWGSRNDHDDTTAILGLLLGLATLGILLSDDDGANKDTYKRKYPPRKVHRKPVPRHLILPSDCLRTYRMQDGKRKFFSKRCMKRNFSYYSKLPRSCRDTIVARNKQGTYVTRKVYYPRCLRKHGYRQSRYY